MRSRALEQPLYFDVFCGASSFKIQQDLNLTGQEEEPSMAETP